MKNLLERVAQETPKNFDYEWLGKFVRSIDPQQLDYRTLLPQITSQHDYARNILCLEPFECVLLYWPPGVESAVHHHEGFWGYVLCLEGAIDNIEYTLKDGQLLESRAVRAYAGGVLNEPDGTIHKIVNASDEEYLVTLHFYYPALDNLDQLRLFDLEGGRIATLNEKAVTASFGQPDECYRTIEENAFVYISLEENNTARSHRIYPILPKPDSSRIAELLSAYYKEQAFEYDGFDLKHKSRKKYTERINTLIAEYLKKIQPDRVLDLACGTGRRAADIKALSGIDYTILGIDLSPEMCAVARNRNINAEAGNWLQMEMAGEEADVVTFLYAYGHIPTEQERKESLEKVYATLKPGGYFFFDAFNINDQTEWGPQAVKAFEEHNLESFGYERGDVFYQKVGGEEVAFLHYCEEDKLKAFVESVGFKVEAILHIGYVHNSGEILDRNDAGALFVIARKD